MAKYSLGISLSQARNLQPHSLQTSMGWRYIWTTTICVWLLSLLPWRNWIATPDILLVVIVFWSFHEPRRMGMVAAFCFGLTLDVHDVGYRYARFEAGMVFTCEPGIYIPEEGIGIRLENNILITETGNVDLMASIPLEAEEIESLMAQPAKSLI